MAGPRAGRQTARLTVVIVPPPVPGEAVPMTGTGIRTATGRIALALALWVALVLPLRADAIDTAIDSIRNGEFAAALEMLAPLAERGDPRAEYLLGIIYLEGLGVAVDGPAAVAHFAAAAEAGFPPADTRLGVIYADGMEGVPRDEGRAARHIRTAAYGSDPEAQHILGMFHLWGSFGQARDADRAALWFRRARAGGMEESDYVLRVLALPAENRRAFAESVREEVDRYPHSRTETHASFAECVHSLKLWSMSAAVLVFTFVVVDESPDRFLAALRGPPDEFAPGPSSIWLCEGPVLRLWF